MVVFLHMKLRTLILAHGSIEDHLPVFNRDLNPFVLAWKCDTDIEDLGERPWNVLRARAVFRSRLGWLYLGGGKHPKYDLEVVPLILEQINIFMTACQWRRWRPGFVNDIHSKCCPDVPQQVVISELAQKCASLLVKHQHMNLQLKAETAKRRRLEKTKHEAQELQLAERKWMSQYSLQSMSNNLYYDKVGHWRAAHITFRRTLANIAACKFGVATGTDTTHSTVNALEIKTSAGLQWGSVEFFGFVDRLLETCVEPFESWALYFMRCDATTAAVWQKQPLHGLEVKLKASVHGRIFAQRVLADILAVGDKTAAGFIALIEKQLRSVGCPILWSEKFDENISDFALRVFCVCTDAGGDISAARRKLKLMILKVSVLVLFLECDCLHHQFALGVGSVLKLADRVLKLLQLKLKVKASDRMRYIASVMKLFNAWREHACAAFFIWTQHDEAHALKFASRMPPRCIPHRWGSKEECEDLLCSVPRTEFATVMKQTFDPRMRKLSRAAKSRTSVSANSEFQAAIAEAQPGQNDYSATMGKFCQDAVRAMESDLWWLMIHVSHELSKPWMHLRRKLQKHRKYVEKGGVGTLARLVHNPHKLHAEYLGLRALGHWDGILLLFPSLVENALLDAVNESIMELALLNELEFAERILKRVTSFPLKLLLFAKQRPEVPCDERRALSDEILSLPNEHLEINCAKLRAFARPVLQMCAVDGTIPGRFYEIWLNVARDFQGDTEAMEGLNRVMKQEVRGAPHISQGLLSARLVNKNLLDQVVEACGARSGADIKWSLVENKFWELCDSTAQLMPHAINVLADIDRFALPVVDSAGDATPVPTVPALEDAAPAAAAAPVHAAPAAPAGPAGLVCKRDDGALVPWACEVTREVMQTLSSLQRQWYTAYMKELVDDLLMSSIFFGVTGQEDEVAYLTCRTYSYVGYLRRCKREGDKYVILQPEERLTTLDMLREELPIIEAFSGLTLFIQLPSDDGPRDWAWHLKLSGCM